MKEKKVEGFSLLKMVMGGVAREVDKLWYKGTTVGKVVNKAILVDRMCKTDVF